MSSIATNILWAVAGSVAGYWVAVRRLEQQHNDRLNEVIDTTREHYRLKYDKRAYRPRIAVEVEHVETPEPSEEVQPLGVLPVEDAAKTAWVNAGLTRVMMDYNGISTKPKEETPEAKTEDTPPGETPASDLPFIITEEQYFENVSGLAQFECVYYVGDDILAGQSGRIVTSFNRAFNLGENVIEILKTGVNMPDTETLYVSSKRAGEGVGADFQVFRHAGLYTEEVGPIGSVE